MYSYGTPYSSIKTNDIYHSASRAPSTSFTTCNSPPSVYKPWQESYYNISTPSSGYCSPGSACTSFNSSPSYSYYQQPSYSFTNFNSYDTKNPTVPSFNSSQTPDSFKRTNKRSRDEPTEFGLNDTPLENRMHNAENPNKKQKCEKQPQSFRVLVTNQPMEEGLKFNEIIDDCDLNDESLSTIDGKKRVLTKDQRTAANQRERKRMNIMNGAFNDLRACLPISTGRKRRKMSRLDIVIGAMDYIDYLSSILETPGNGPVEINFEAYQNNLFMLD